MAAKKKSKAKGKKKAGSKKAANGDGRDASGKFVKGEWKGGPGRPKGINIREAIEEIAAKEKVDLRAAAWEVMESMRTRAMDGDSTAAKLWMDRLGGLLTQAMEVTSTKTVTLITEDERKRLQDLGTDDGDDLKAKHLALLRARTNGTNGSA